MGTFRCKKNNRVRGVTWKSVKAGSGKSAYVAASTVCRIYPFPPLPPIFVSADMVTTATVGSAGTVTVSVSPPPPPPPPPPPITPPPPPTPILASAIAGVEAELTSVGDVSGLYAAWWLAENEYLFTEGLDGTDIVVNVFQKDDPDNMDKWLDISQGTVYLTDGGGAYGDTVTTYSSPDNGYLTLRTPITLPASDWAIYVSTAYVFDATSENLQGIPVFLFGNSASVVNETGIRVTTPTYDEFLVGNNDGVVTVKGNNGVGVTISNFGTVTEGNPGNADDISTSGGIFRLARIGSNLSIRGPGGVETTTSIGSLGAITLDQFMTHPTQPNVPTGLWREVRILLQDPTDFDSTIMSEMTANIETPTLPPTGNYATCQSALSIEGNSGSLVDIPAGSEVWIVTPDVFNYQNQNMHWNVLTNEGEGSPYAAPGNFFTYHGNCDVLNDFTNSVEIFGSEIVDNADFINNRGENIYLRLLNPSGSDIALNVYVNPTTPS